MPHWYSAENLTLITPISSSSQSPVFIHGHGSVSAAGFDAHSLYQACCGKDEIPVTTLSRQVDEETIDYRVRAVDQAALRTMMPRHPRLRRSSSVSKFAFTAATEALGEERITHIQNGELRLGIVVSFMNGCVNYSNRFYTEVLADPSLASPLIFPETVFNAPASHIAAHLNSDGPAYSLLGDSSAWFSAIDIARGWLDTNQVDGCLVICAEELDWLSCEGLTYYSREIIATEGAAAIYLENTPSKLAMTSLQGPFEYTNHTEKITAVSSAWECNDTDNLLVDGLTGVKKIDSPELDATSNWNKQRLSPLATLGSGMAASCGFQTIAALEALQHKHSNSLVFCSGDNQQAFLSRFQKI